MFVWIFLFYFSLFLLIFAGSKQDFKNKKGKIIKMLVLPAILGLIIAFLFVLKFYIIYKIVVLLFLIVTSVLSYWHFGDSVRRWLEK